MKEEFRNIAIFLGLIWLAFLINWLLGLDLVNWGIVPRTAFGLLGVPLAPFLHASLGHITSNSIPLFILLTLLIGSRSKTWATVAEITLLGGGLLWLFGRNANHVGASGLVYGLIAFLIVAGFCERRFASLIVALLVGFLYGSTLLFGVIPSQQGVSWDGHLFGALAGAGLAYLTLRTAGASPSEPQQDTSAASP